MLVIFVENVVQNFFFGVDAKENYFLVGSMSLNIVHLKHNSTFRNIFGPAVEEKCRFPFGGRQVLQ